MSHISNDLVAMLLARHIIGPEQLVEAREARQGEEPLELVLVRLGHVSPEALGLLFIDLTDVTIPPAILELVPESVARENVVLPLSLDGGILKIIMSDPTDFETVQKLQFILNKD